MKTTIKIAVIAMMGMSLGVNAQEWNTNGNNSTTGSVYAGEYVLVSDDGKSGFYIQKPSSSDDPFKITMGSQTIKGGLMIGREDWISKVMIPWNVGIGTDDPKAKLHIKGVSQIEHSNGRSIRFDGYNGIATFGPSHWLHLNRYSDDNVAIGHNSTANVYMVNGGGDVGIGTITPSTKLHVKGVSQIEHSNGRSIRFDGYNGIATFGPSHWLHLNRYSDDNVAIGHNSTANVYMVKGGGNVGIGTDKPTAKLAVNGKIHTKEVRVDLNLSDWADFVFEKEYNLPTLKEVENHIKEKGHLKDIPSAKEVEKNGFYLGKMDAKLLQKIEELTLYTIEQEKKIKAFEKEKLKIEKQEKEINTQKKEIDELKALVQKLLKDKN